MCHTASACNYPSDNKTMNTIYLLPYVCYNSDTAVNCFLSKYTRIFCNIVVFVYIYIYIYILYIYIYIYIYIERERERYIYAN